MLFRIRRARHVGLNHKALHRKAIRAMGVQQLDAANSTFADQGGDSRKGHIQAHGFRQGWSKKAGLHFAAMPRFGLHQDGKNAGRWRMRVQVKLQQT